jgi:light-regulated signal transduction histidine kinase (bacteriophytochrome)
MLGAACSHDLQEPLRMISSYLQLLARRYQGQLDAAADDFIGFAVDGATRMQAMLAGLLHYSRVDTQGKPFAVVNGQDVWDQAVHRLRGQNEVNGAVVTHDSLPLVRGDARQLLHLFQNLIDNALKFRTQNAPRIHVAAAPTADEWVFSVRDNGMGIEPQHVEGIFAIFQRLHGQDAYPGAGMGLPICKRIIARHGGRIWVESKPGKGSRFYFTLPNATTGVTPENMS